MSSKSFSSRRAHKKSRQKKIVVTSQTSAPASPPFIIRSLATFCVISATCISFITQNDFYKAQNFLLSDQASYAEIATTSRQTTSSDKPYTDKLDLPILVYHVVRPSYPDDSTEVRAIAQTPEVFDAQMAYLKENGYHIVTFRDLETYYELKKPLPQNPIILSFDDGWKDQFTYAFPVLKKYGYLATFFIFTNSIDHKNFLSLKQLHELLASGMTIGAHSRTHPYLTAINDKEELWREINGSKETLEVLLGVPIHEFAYPFGRYDDTIVAMAKKAGYRSARGDYFTGVQSSDRLFELSAINAPTTLELFSKKFPKR